MRLLSSSLLLFGMFVPVLCASGSTDSPSVKPDSVISELKQGNERFTKGESSHPNTDIERILETSEQGQHPVATVITCSDSRVPVERVFDQGVGDLFVIRVAGNVCDVDEIGSIEYGVDHLGTPLMIVLGHTHCGAVTAVVTGAELHGSIPPLVDNIQPAVEVAQKAHPLLHGEDLVPSAVEENVWQSIDDLFKSSPATRKRVEAGTLSVVGAIYNIEDGSVKWLGKHSEQNRLLAYTGGGVDHVETPHEEQTVETPHEEQTVETPHEEQTVETPHEEQTVETPHEEQTVEASAENNRSYEEFAQTAVTPVSVTLIEPTKQAALDRGRHREIKAEPGTLVETSNGSNSYWTAVLFLAGLGLLSVVLWKFDVFGRLSVAARLFAGFGSVIGIVFLSGLAGLWSLSKVGDQCDIQKTVLNLDLFVSELDTLQNEFLLAGVEDKQQAEKLIEKHHEVLDSLNVQIKATNDLSLNESEKEALAQLDEKTQSYTKSFSELTGRFHKIETLKEQLNAQDEQVEEQLSQLLSRQESNLEALIDSGGPGREIDRKIHLIGLLTKSELQAMRVFHTEAEFLMNKHVSHISILEQQLGQLYGHLKATKKALSLVDELTHAESKSLAALANVERKIEKYQEELGSVVENELLLAANQVDCTERLHQIQILTEAVSTKAQADRQAAQLQASMNMWILIVLTTFVGGLLAWFTSHSITQRLHHIVVMIRDVAEGEGKGDLRRRLPMRKANCSAIKKCGKTDCPEYGKVASCWDTVGSNASGEIHCPSILSGKLKSCHECPIMQEAIRDEVDEVSAWFNTLLGKLSQLIHEVDVNASGISTSSVNLATAATQLASGTEEMSGKSATVASTADKMSNDMNQMASSTEQVTANVQTVSSAVEEMTASISEIAANAEQAASVAGNAAQLARSSNENIGQLGTAADEIGKVIETIQDIAEQTNLLALNATIEAARAGDAGKGFAVVATEVKELAKQTAVATEDIRGRIEGIQNTSGQAVHAIGEISQVIDQVNDFSKTIASAVEEQSATTKEIAQNISDTSSAVQAVSDGVSESASSTNEITLNITGVDQSVKQAAESASHTQSACDELSRMAEQLQELVQPFKV